MIAVVALIQLGAVLVLQHLLAQRYAALALAKYPVVLGLAAAGALLPKPTREHVLLSRALVFLAVGDFFLIFLGGLPGFSPEDYSAKIGGMLGFGVAYAHLIAAFRRGARASGLSVPALLAVLAIETPIAIVCLWYGRGGMVALSLPFAALVGALAYHGMMTSRRGYFRPEIARRFAVAGCLMLLSDMGVGLGFFHPALHRNVPLLGNAIWITYIPAWALIAATMAQTVLTIEVASNSPLPPTLTLRKRREAVSG
ncbi:MAG: hypothetical protein HYV63_30190 [Candidatus Schekmanbacteria bacterium]|nr:hypothetical protein [Candidatus Schekmanbacteria bacterium]